MNLKVILPGEDGEFGVTAGHSPMISQLQPGLVTVVHTSGESEKFFVSGGFAVTETEGTSVTCPEGYPLSEFDPAVVRMVFDRFDFYGTGQLDIKFLQQALGPYPGLEFDVPKPILRHLSQKYDHNDNRCFDFAAFHGMISDPMLQAYYIGKQHQSGIPGEARTSQNLFF